MSSSFANWIEVLEARREGTGKFVFLADGEQQQQILSHARLYDRARAIAHRLGPYRGERALLLYASGLDFIEAFFGCLLSGVLAVPVYPPDPTNLERSLPKLDAIRKASTPKLLLTTGEIAGLAAGLLGAIDMEGVEWIASDGVDEGGASGYRPPAIARDDLAFLQFTSGSTSTPKGVMVTHGNLLRNTAMMKAHIGLEETSCIVSWLPLYHDMGLIGKIMNPVLCGCDAVVMAPQHFLAKPMRWLRAISEHRGTASSAPNFAYDLCVRKATDADLSSLDLSSWHRAMNGAEPVRGATLSRFAERFAPCGFSASALTPGYGLAEATLCVSVGRSDPVSLPTAVTIDKEAYARGAVIADPTSDRELVASGCPTERVRIVDPASKRPCEAGTVGEIWVAGDSVALGYWNNPAATAEVFAQRIAGEEEAIYLRTGDLGFLRGGELFVSGRVKDTLIVRGENHYPQDLEATAERAHPSVRRGCVIAFDAADAVEAPGAPARIVIVAEITGADSNGADSNGAEDEANAVAAAIRRAVLGDHGVGLCDVALIRPRSLPKTSSGKVQRRACRTAYLQGSLALVAGGNGARGPARQAGTDALATGGGSGAHGEATRRGVAEIGAWLRAWVGERHDMSPASVRMDAAFADFGIDSASGVELAADLESWLGAPVSPTAAWNHPTINALAMALGGAAQRDGDGSTPMVAIDADGERRREPLAIVGMAARFAGAEGLEAYWNLLARGDDAVCEASDARLEDRPERFRGYALGGFLEDVAGFDRGFFGINAREAAQMDPQQRLVMEVAFEAFEDAGIRKDQLVGSRTGAFVGLSSSDYAERFVRDPELIDGYSGTGNSHAVAANRLSYWLDLRGPSVAIDTACSSSLSAFHLAAQSVWNGDAEQAIAAGVNLVISPAVSQSHDAAGVLSPSRRCRVFSAEADGTLRADGAGAVVLKPLARALADGDRVYAVVRATGMNQDGRTNGIIAPSEEAQKVLLREVCARADVAPSDVCFVEAHGTGTVVGDAIEARGLGAVFGGSGRTRPFYIGSVKSNIGHAEAAAGIAGLIKTALALHHRLLPASLYSTPPNQKIPWDELSMQVPIEAIRLDVGDRPDGLPLAGVSGFGFGGTNVHALLQAVPRTRSAELAPDAPVLLPLSAHSTDALRARVTDLAKTLRARPGDAAAIVHTVANRASRHRRRAYAIGRGPADLATALERLASDGDLGGQSEGAASPGAALVFSGHGGQWSGMGKRLFADSHGFRDAIEACSAAAKPFTGWSLRALFAAGIDSDCAPADAAAIDVVQPALCALQIGLARLWQSVGIETRIVVGHSMGEVAAAHIAGVLTLEDAFRIICVRSRLMRTVAGAGSMAVVELDAARAREVMADVDPSLCVAAENSPRSTVVAGDAHGIEALLQRLADEGVFCRQIRVEMASHSAHVDPMLEELRRELAAIAPRPAELEMISTVTNRRIEGYELDAGYWCENLRRTVRFAPVMAGLIERGEDRFIEIGAHPTLTQSIAETADGFARPVLVVPSMRRDDGSEARDERQVLLQAIGDLFVSGLALDLASVTPGGPITHLPPYPFQRERCWLDERAATSLGAGWFGAPIASSTEPGTVLFPVLVDGRSREYLRDHVVDGSALLPAAAFIDIALAGAREVRGGAAGEAAITAMRLVQPLGLEDTDRLQVQLALQPTTAGHGRLRFAIRSRRDSGWGADIVGEPDPAVHQWSLHAQGLLVSPEAAATPSATAVGALPAIRDALDTAQDVAALYSTMAGHGVEYGDAFRTLRQLWVAGHGDRRSALGEIELGDEQARGPGADHILHPAVLDGCLHVLGALLANGKEVGGTEDGAIYLPVAIEHVRCHRPLLRGPVYSHGTLRQGADRDDMALGNTAAAPIGDLRVYGADGELCAEILGLKLARLSGGRRREERLEDQVLEVAFELRPHLAGVGDATTPGGDHYLVVTAEASDADGGLGDGLVAELRRRGHQVAMAHTDTRTTNGATDCDGWRRRLEAMADGRAGRALRGVIHAGSALTASQSFAAAQAGGSADLLGLLQAMVAIDAAEPPRLWLVTRGALSAGDDGDRAAMRPEQAPAAGLVRVAAHEHPELQPTHLDVSGAGVPTAQQAAWLADELYADDGETTVALRRDGRHVMRLVRPSPTTDDGPMATVAADQTTAYALENRHPGMLDGFSLIECPRPLLGHGQIEIEVRAAGLNFLDVLGALGARPDIDRGSASSPSAPPSSTPAPSSPPLGAELAGIVRRVGPGVPWVRVGDRVVAFAAGAFASHVVTPASLARPLPMNVDFAAAATLPVAFGTARYALFDLGRLRSGERVLIHAGTGGLGQAAIQLALAAGATVFATASTAEKRAMLEKMGVAAAFDSRSDAFVAGVRDATAGGGVDLVLNCLAGDLVEAGLSLLRPRGRFLEVGKRDIYSDRSLSLGHFRRNVSYHGIDLLTLLQDDPAYGGVLLDEILADLAAGRITPLPHSVIAADRASEAFATMAQARHTGKLLLRFGQSGLAVKRDPRRLSAATTYLITGGLGGVGLTTARAFVAAGARHLALLGRGAPSGEVAAAIDALRAVGVQVTCIGADVRDAGQVRAAIAQIDASMPRLAGIVHAAGVLDDATLEALDTERLSAVMAPKALGALNLAAAIGERPLDFFWLYGSAASILGAPGQGNYVAANAYLDAFAHARGRNTTTLSWGPFSNVGLAAATARRREHVAATGVTPFNPEEGEAMVRHLIGGPGGQRAPLRLDVAELRKRQPSLAEAPILRALVAGAGSPTPEASGLLAELEALSGRDRGAALVDHVRGELGRVLRVHGDSIELRAPFRDLGVDSLMAVELRNRLERSLDLRISATALFNYPNLEALGAFLSKRLGWTADATEDPGDRNAIPADTAGATVGLAEAERKAGIAAVEAADEQELERLLEAELAELGMEVGSAE